MEARTTYIAKRMCIVCRATVDLPRSAGLDDAGWTTIQLPEPLALEGDRYWRCPTCTREDRRPE